MAIRGCFRPSTAKQWIACGTYGTNLTRCTLYFTIIFCKCSTTGFKFMFLVPSWFAHVSECGGTGAIWGRQGICVVTKFYTNERCNPSKAFTTRKQKKRTMSKLPKCLLNMTACVSLLDVKITSGFVHNMIVLFVVVLILGYRGRSLCVCLLAFTTSFFILSIPHLDPGRPSCFVSTFISLARVCVR